MTFMRISSLPFRARSSSGRAIDLHSIGKGFESPRVHSGENDEDEGHYSLFIFYISSLPKKMPRSVFRTGQPLILHSKRINQPAIHKHVRSSLRLTGYPLVRSHLLNESNRTVFCGRTLLCEINTRIQTRTHRVARVTKKSSVFLKNVNFFQANLREFPRDGMS